MKTYKFAVHNWHNDLYMPFWMYKEFPSAYAATVYADRISFNRNSKYIVVCQYGEETPSDGRKGSKARRTA